MDKKKYKDYATDPVFERYVQPYDKNGSQQLLNAILDDIDGRVVHVWRGVHLNDKTKYEICLKHTEKTIVKKEGGRVIDKDMDIFS